MRLELSERQRESVDLAGANPVEVIDPASNRTYILLAQEEYDRLRSSQVPRQAERDAADVEIPPGVLRSQQAFWRDLPELLAQHRKHGLWVCYLGDEQIGTARTKVALIGECLRRGIDADDYHIDIIQPRDLAPWAEEEIAPRQGPVAEEGQALLGPSP